MCLLDKKRGERDNPAKDEEERVRQKILKTVDAIERYLKMRCVRTAREEKLSEAALIC